MARANVIKLHKERKDRIRQIYEKLKKTKENQKFYHQIMETTDVFTANEDLYDDEGKK